MRKHTPVIVFAFLAVLGVTHPVAAAPVTYIITEPVPVTRSPFGNPGVSFLFPGYDPSLPPLQSVTLSLITAATTVSGLTYFNPDLTPVLSDSVLLEESFSLFFPSGTPLGATVTTSGFGGVNNVPPRTTVPVSSINLPTQGLGRTLTGPTQLDFFTESSDVSLNVQGLFFTTSLDPLRIGGTPTPSVNVTLTVTYTPVPEPSTFALVGIGMGSGLLCGWRRWRRNRCFGDH